MEKISISNLTTGETIELLKKLPAELCQTPYTRNGLIMHLYIKALKPTDNQREQKQAGDYLKSLLQTGSEMDKVMVASFKLKI